MSRFRKLSDRFTAFLRDQFPKTLTPEQIKAQFDAEFEAGQAAERESARQNKLARVRRIAPFIGKLFLLTDFGPLESDWPQHTTRTIDALGAFGLRPDMRVGTSVHLGQTRGARAKGWQFDTQISICTGLRDRGYGTVLQPQHPASRPCRQPARVTGSGRRGHQRRTTQTSA